MFLGEGWFILRIEFSEMFSPDVWVVDGNVFSFFGFI